MLTTPHCPTSFCMCPCHVCCRRWCVQVRCIRAVVLCRSTFNAGDVHAALLSLCCAECLLCILLCKHGLCCAPLFSAVPSIAARAVPFCLCAFCCRVPFAVPFCVLFCCAAAVPWALYIMLPCCCSRTSTATSYRLFYAFSVRVSIVCPSICSATVFLLRSGTQSCRLHHSSQRIHSLITLSYI